MFVSGVGIVLMVLILGHILGLGMAVMQTHGVHDDSGAWNGRWCDGSSHLRGGLICEMMRCHSTGPCRFG